MSDSHDPTELPPFTVQVPWAQGQSVFSAPNWQSTNDPIVDAATQQSVRGAQAALPGGRWIYSPRSTAPFAQATTGTGGRTLFLGDTLEVPQGSRATVRNASFHTGEGIFECVGEYGAGGPGGLRPATVTIPAHLKLTNNYLGNGPAFRSRPLDVRYARRAWLWIQLPAPLLAPLPYRVRHVADRGDSYDTPSLSGTTTFPQNILLDTHAQGVYGNALPLGIGSGRDLWPATVQTLPDLRPMALLDWLQFESDQNDLQNAGYTTGQAAFLTLEY